MAAERERPSLMRGSACREHAPAAAAAVIGIACAFFAYRGEIYLGFDQFFYTQFARFIAHGEWARLTGVWPAGSALLGAPLIALGIPAGMAMVLVNCGAFLLVQILLNRMLREAGMGWGMRLLVCAAGAALPVWHRIVATPLSEAPFTAAVLLLIFALIRFPAVSAIRLAVIGAGAALLFRYIGAVIAPAVGLTLLHQWRRSRPAFPAQALLWSALPFAVIAAVMVANMLLFNSPLGSYRPPVRDSPFDVAAQYGMGWISVLSSTSSIPSLGGAELYAGGLVILVLLLGAVAILADAAESRTVHAAALVLLLYSLGFILVRTLTYTDIEAPRRAAPMVPLLLLFLTSPRVNRRRVLVMSVLAAVAMTGLVQSVRSYSRADPMLPVRAITAVLAPLVHPEDVVLVNYEAKSVLRALDADIRFSDEEGMEQAMRDASFVVLAARWNSARRTYEFSPAAAAWRDAGLVEDSGGTLIHASSTVVIFWKARARGYVRTKAARMGW